MTPLLRPLVASIACAAIPLTGTATVNASAAATPASGTAGGAACSDAVNDPAEPVVDPADVATFGPLAADPALRVTSAATIVSADYVPGGVLLMTGVDEGVPTALTLVEDSGTVRWQRCLDPGTYVNVYAAAPAASTPEAVLMSFATDAGPTVEEVDLATGAGTPVEWDAAHSEYAASSDGWLLYRPTTNDGLAPAGTPLTLIDLATLAVTPVPAPDIPAGTTFEQFEVSDAGVVGLAPPNVPGSTIGWVFVDGAWTDDGTAIDATFPIQTDYSVQHPISFATASGAKAWSVPGLYWAADEGFHDRVVGDVMVVRGCGSVDAATRQCVSPVLAAFDAATGDELWRFDGGGWVAASGDGYALIGGAVPGGDESQFQVTMIDVATGEPVDGQVWPSDTFHGGCCGDPAFTAADGGVVLTSDGNVLDVFVPAAAATPTVEVTL